MGQDEARQDEASLGDASQGDTRQNGTGKHAARNAKYKVRREKLVEVRLDKVSLG